MTNCDICGEDLWGADHSDLVDVGKESIWVCHDCKPRVSKLLEEGQGKFVLDRCKECGHLKSVKFQRYKKRGRPSGKTTDPVKAAKRKGIKLLDTFA